MRTLDAEAIEDLAVGAAVLGGGGGGDPYLSKLIAQEAVRAHGPVGLVGADEVADGALVLPLGMIGAPTVVMERIFAADTFPRALRRLEERLGRRADAVMPLEIGGFNALVPFAAAARLGLPVVDADSMGRALPEIQMTSFTLRGLPACPLVLADDQGNSLVIEAADNAWAERLVRAGVVELGGVAAAALYPLSGRQLREAALLGTVSLGLGMGQALRAARTHEQSRIETVRAALGGTIIFEGRVVDVQRQPALGFARGEARIEGSGPFQRVALQLFFQNEYLVARSGATVYATTPDLIALFDARTGAPIAVEQLRYGFQVTVIAAPASAIWRSPAGLGLVGPRAFGYPLDYLPIEEHGHGLRPLHN